MSAEVARTAGARDALWTAATAGLGAVLQVAQLAIAARVLSTAEFGALAIVNISLALISALQDLGLSSYCVYLGHQPRRTHSTLFWLSAGIGALAMLGLVIAAPFIAAFYRMPALSLLLAVTSLNFVLVGFGSQYQAHLVRTFQSRLLAKIEVVSRLPSFGVTVALLVGAKLGVLSIVIGSLVFAACKTLGMARVAEPDWHPRREFDRAIAPAALRYGLFQAGSQLVGQLRLQIDQLVLGRLLGAESLGAYSLARELMNYPMRVLQPLFGRLVLPILARNQNDPLRLADNYFLALQRTALVCSALYAALALFAPWVVQLLYGGRHANLVALAAVLTLAGALRPLGMNAGMLAQATGKTRIEFSWNLLSAGLAIPLTAALAVASTDIATFAAFNSGLQVVMTLLAWPLFVSRLLPGGFWRYVATWAPGALLVLACIVFRMV